jgi:hypothetical protein
VREKREKNTKSRKIQKNRMYIIHGPEQKTEMNYFKSFIRAMGDKRNCPVIPDTLSMKSNTCDPVKLVERAIDFLNDNENKHVSSCWVLGDRDENFDIQEAVKLAKSFVETNKWNQKIKVIWSNQAFEIWYIYHFRQISGYKHRKNYENDLNKFFEKNRIGVKYKKADANHFSYLKRLLNTAVDNAELSYQQHIFKQHKSPNEACSCTNVFELVKELNKISPKKIF